LQHGWHMYEHPWDFERGDWTPTGGAKRFEAGSPNTVGQAALDASVRLLLDYGMENVGNRVLANTGFLLTELGKIEGVNISSRKSPDRRSGIVTFNHETVALAKIHKRLTAAGVSVAIRGDSIRVSPHFYQGEKQLLRFIALLDLALSG
jgi:cysteine desulfurase/selenocysteine lyase